MSGDASKTPWRIKLDRARFHLQSLEQLIETLKSSGQLEALTEESGDRRAVRVVLKGELPSEIPAIIGDILHNTRSALDCLAFEICQRGAELSDRHLSEKQERKLQFPICIDSGTFKDDARSRLRCAPRHIVEVIRTTQPFYLPMLATPVSDGEFEERAKSDRLWQLAELSNADKHRGLHLVAAVPGDIYAGASDGLNVVWRWNDEFGPDDDIAGWWILHPTGDRVEFHPHAETCVSLLDHHLSPGPPIEVVRYLSDLVQYVDQSVVSRLERALLELDEGGPRLHLTRGDNR